MTGSNRRPPPCKGDALPTELITHILSLVHCGPPLEWWVMTGSNRRPPPCKGDALPTELITPAVWSRIIGILRSESTLFKTKMRVRFKIRHHALLLANMLVLLAETQGIPPLRWRTVIEDSTPGARMCAPFFRV